MHKVSLLLQLEHLYVYIFTEKLLQLRGMHETLFMGSNTAEKVIKKKLSVRQTENLVRLLKNGYKKTFKSNTRHY